MLILFTIFLACGSELRSPRASSKGSSTTQESGASDGETLTLEEFWSFASAIEYDIHERVTQHRKERDLDELIPHNLLVDLTRAHSEAMAMQEVPLGHDGFEERYDIIVDEICYDIFFVAENVGYSDTIDNAGETIFANWLSNEEYRGNIEGPFHLSSIGSFELENQVYATQIFVQVQ